MTSEDRQQNNFITVEVFNARMDRLEAITERNAALMREENAKFRLEVRGDMENFKNEVRSDIDNFKSEVRSDIDSFKNEVRNDIANFKNEVRSDVNNLRSEMREGFDRVNSQIVVLQRDNEGLKHDVAGLYHWDYWLLSIILFVIAAPQIVSGVKAIFGAIIDGIAGILAVFRNK